MIMHGVVVNSLRKDGTSVGVKHEGKASKDELTLTDNEPITSININVGLDHDTVSEILVQINKEKESVKKYGGYYIGRYETGIENDKAVIKQNVTPYASILWKKAYTLARGIGGGKDATTYLCSSYAWDTAINFIQNNSGKTNYATTTDELNGNWKSKDVVDNNGDIIKNADTGAGLKTGSTTSLCNIYDMGGNVAELTTEILPGTYEPTVLRGGSYTGDLPSGIRYDGGADVTYASRGFRTTLFLK